MSYDWLPQSLGLFFHHAKVITHCIDHGCSLLRGNQLLKVQGIDVDLVPLKPVCNFLRLDQQKLPLFLKLAAKFIQGPQANLLPGPLSPRLYPVLAKGLPVFLDHRSPLDLLAPLDSRNLHPLFPLAQDVVI